MAVTSCASCGGLEKGEAGSGVKKNAREKKKKGGPSINRNDNKRVRHNTGLLLTATGQEKKKGEDCHEKSAKSGYGMA